MHAFTPAEIHPGAHAARTAEPAVEAAARRLVRHVAPAAAQTVPATQAVPAVPAAPALRNRLGGALVGAGIRLTQPAHVRARIAHAPHAAQLPHAA
ncbi:hypothetical protein ACFXGI_28200 [Streptomyces sp. NPDC059355]|uniref:hypothetical protein n=1 Tax=Streptomyces sp. NPDC059355 TaxID=3346811 RepID=UPI0036B70BEB